VVERISGLGLEDYFQKFIFEPAGIKNLSFFLNDVMQESLAGMHMRPPGGEIVSIPHPFLPERTDGYFEGGGGKIFGQVKSYTGTLLFNLF
jgi:CubicO group peptidase (beta-lactamase class C family)